MYWQGPPVCRPFPPIPAPFQVEPLVMSRCGRGVVQWLGSGCHEPLPGLVTVPGHRGRPGDGAWQVRPALFPGTVLGHGAWEQRPEPVMCRLGQDMFEHGVPVCRRVVCNLAC
jgi:hypothetical protein